jgi:adenylyl-sulfate kinase
MLNNPFCLWFTGLSGSGKTTISSAVSKKLSTLNRMSYVLDGDELRRGLNSDLGFSDADRAENVRRTAALAKVLLNAGVIPIVALISPFQKDRDQARSLFNPDEFIEVYVSTPLSVCEQRDPKGLYKSSRAGLLRQFTGIESLYESPNHPEITIDGSNNPDAPLTLLWTELQKRGLV